MTGENITIDGSYPVDIYDDVLKLLRSAQHNEFEEFEPVYPDFAAVANQEGFTNIGAKFNQIAKIEKHTATDLVCLQIFWSRASCLYLMLRKSGCA